MGTWSPEILDEFLAPEISKFTSATISSIEAEHPNAIHWIQTLFLGSIFNATYKEEIRPVMVQFLRRASAGFHYYHNAKKVTDTYLSVSNPLNPKSKQYYEAVDLWEGFVLQIQIAIDAFNKINKMFKIANVFEPGDGSKEQRLYEIGNCIKHFAGKKFTKKKCTMDTFMAHK